MNGAIAFHFCGVLRKSFLYKVYFTIGTIIVIVVGIDTGKHYMRSILIHIALTSGYVLIIVQHTFHCVAFGAIGKQYFQKYAQN